MSIHIIEDIPVKLELPPKILARLVSEEYLIEYTDCTQTVTFKIYRATPKFKKLVQEMIVARMSPGGVVKISEPARALMRAHMWDNGETNEEKTLDELFEVADQAWSMKFPRMEEPWIKFKQYLHH